MTYRGKVRNGTIVLDEPVSLPEGTVVRVEAVAQPTNGEGAAAAGTVWDRLLELAGKAEGLPADASRNHDHYLYGAPKR